MLPKPTSTRFTYPSYNKKLRKYMENITDTHKCKNHYQWELAEICESEAGDDYYRKVCNICGREYEPER